MGLGREQLNKVIAQMSEEAERRKVANEARLERFLAQEVRGNNYITFGVADKEMWQLAKERLDIDDVLLFPPISEQTVSEKPLMRRRRFPTNAEFVYCDIVILNTPKGWIPSAKELIKLGSEAEKAFRKEINK